MEQRVTKIVLVAVMTVMLLLTVVVNYLSTSAAGRSSGLFENKANSSLPWSQRGNIRDSGLTPPGFAFIIWAIIYLYQGCVLAYSWSLLFRTDAGGSYLCCSSGLLPTASLVLHSLSSVWNIAWVFLADRVDTTPGLLVPQTFAIFLLAACVAGATGAGYHGACQAAGERRRQLAAGQQPLLAAYELPLLLGLAVNGNGFYAGWVAVASFLNVDIAIINLSGWSLPASGALCLAQFVMVALVYVVLDLVVLRLHFLHSPHAAVIWALATSAGKNFDAKSATTVLSVQLAVVLALVMVAKVALAVMRCMRPEQQQLKVAPEHTEKP